MKKVLFVASMVKLHIVAFHIPYLKWFKDNGYEVHVCARNDYENKEELAIPFCDKYYNLPFERSPFHNNNFYAYKSLKQVIKTNEYDTIHCHTPIGGVLTRLAARSARKLGTKVLYTAHGFHFFKGASLVNWLLYYPVERWLARFTDVLITINKEDYQRATSFKVNKVEYVPGVGVDVDKFRTLKLDKTAKRESLGLSDDSFVLLSVGELNKNKNHEVVIKAIAQLKNRNVNYVLCGEGPLEFSLKELASELNIEDNVHFLGFRSDIPEICKMADMFVFPSYREGLSLALMEAMASGLPIVCSNIRGNTDLIEDGKGGYLVKPNDVNGWTVAIKKMMCEDRLAMSEINCKKVEEYELKSVLNQMGNIYKRCKTPIDEVS